MQRIVPDEKFYDLPCSIVAVSLAKGGQIIPTEVSKTDGYMTLRDMNTYVRQNLSVAKRTDYKRGQRPILKALRLDGRAIVCVLGHYIYLENETYYSFFQNDYDQVVAVWKLKD